MIGRPTGQSVRPVGRSVHTLRQSDRQSDEIKDVLLSWSPLVSRDVIKTREAETKTKTKTSRVETKTKTNTSKKVVLIGLETKTRSRDMYAMLLYKSSKS